MYIINHQITIGNLKKKEVLNLTVEESLVSSVV